MISSCPRCQSRTFTQGKIFGVETDRCADCQGIWMDGGEYERLIESARDAALAPLPGEARGVRPEAFVPVRAACPRCANAILEPKPIHFELIHHFIVADRCPECYGMWLDPAELSMLLRHMQDEDIRAFGLGQHESESLDEVLPKKPTATGKKGNRGGLEHRAFWRALLGLNSAPKEPKIRR